MESPDQGAQLGEDDERGSGRPIAGQVREISAVMQRRYEVDPVAGDRKVPLVVRLADRLPERDRGRCASQSWWDRGLDLREMSLDVPCRHIDRERKSR